MGKAWQRKMDTGCADRLEKGRRRLEGAGIGI